MKKILSVIGTRPEALKLAPVLQALAASDAFNSSVCLTGQHLDLPYQVLCGLGIPIDHSLPSKNFQNLSESAADLLCLLGALLEEERPDLVIVQGDTTSALVGALAAYYNGVSVAHVEAGLRTNRLNSPWPEEGHRRLIDQITTYYFAPTPAAMQSLLNEGVDPAYIWMVGNTAIDFLRSLPHKDSSGGRRILVTCHRRKMRGEPLIELCRTLKIIAENYPDVAINFVLHPNPHYSKPVRQALANIDTIQLHDPMDHKSFLSHLAAATFVITDSGGIQEEAPYLGKPLIITRDTTERPEGVLSGTSLLVGCNGHKILSACQQLLDNPEFLAKMSKIHTPYGDGYASQRIVSILEKELQ